jgi:hypothetical protein
LNQIADYINRVEKYRTAPFRIRDGVGMYLVKGREVPIKEWENANKVPIYIKRNNKKGENPDRTRDWMHL